MAISTVCSVILTQIKALGISGIVIQITAVGSGHSSTQVASYQEWVRVSGPCSWVGSINVVLYTFPTPLHHKYDPGRHNNASGCWYAEWNGRGGVGREYRIIYRGPGLLAVSDLAFGSSTSPSPLSRLSFLVIQLRESLVLYKTFNALWGAGVGGGAGGGSDPIATTLNVQSDFTKSVDDV